MGKRSDCPVYRISDKLFIVLLEREIPLPQIPVLGEDASVGYLVRILEHTCESRSISYEEALSIAGKDTDDALMLGWQWRLLIPVRTSRCGEWDDRVLMLEPGERYEMPNISRWLLLIFKKTGEWRPQQAISDYFRDSGEPEWAQMPVLAREMKTRCTKGVITAVQISESCRSAGLADRVDTMIAILKGAGVMSPRLGSLNQVNATGMPLYEIHPCLLT